jgi:hypothetical protein
MLQTAAKWSCPASVDRLIKTGCLHFEVSRTDITKVAMASKADEIARKENGSFAYSVEKVGSQSNMLFHGEISRMRNAWNRLLTSKSETQATLMRVCFSLNGFSTE